jgi:hypothetical protein
MIEDAGAAGAADPFQCLDGPDEPGAFASLDRIGTWLQAHEGRADA